MSTKSDSLKGKLTENFYEFSLLSDYSFMNSLKAAPKSTKDGNDHKPRSVYSGHYVPVVPKAIPESEYISHSNKLFKQERLQILIYCQVFLSLLSNNAQKVSRFNLLIDTYHPPYFRTILLVKFF